MRYGFGMFLSEVVLVGQCAGPSGISDIPFRNADYLEMVYGLIGQINVADGAVVVNVGKPYFQAVGIGKETTFGIHVRNFYVGGEIVACISESNAPVAVLAGGITNTVSVEFYEIGIVLDAVGRHHIVGIVCVGEVRPVPQDIFIFNKLKQKHPILHPLCRVGCSCFIG